MRATTNCKQKTHEEQLIEIQKDLEKNGNKIIRIAKDNFPLELIMGKPITNFIRKILLTKYKTNYKQWREKGGGPINFN